MTVQEGIFVSWSGVRGAIGIALALVVESSSKSDRTVDLEDNDSVSLCGTQYKSNVFKHTSLFVLGTCVFDHRRNSGVDIAHKRHVVEATAKAVKARDKNL